MLENYLVEPFGVFWPFNLHRIAQCLELSSTLIARDGFSRFQHLVSKCLIPLNARHYLESVDGSSAWLLRLIKVAIIRVIFFTIGVLVIDPFLIAGDYSVMKTVDNAAICCYMCSRSLS